MKTKLMKPLIVSSGIVITVMSGWWLMRENKKLEIAATNYWGRLEPAFQSTSAGDTLLGNVFEPLVDLSTSGGIAPGLAERWEVNEESTLFRFHLREGVKYSDGSEFEAKDFIRSWINAVQKTELDSEKPNTLDVLYKVKGFSAQTLKSGIIPGLRVIDSNILEIEFEHPFRTALFELTGTRYATWKETHENGVIGTGPYQITEHLPGELVRYAPNPFSEKKARYNEVIVRGFEDAWSEMKSGKWGAYLGKDIMESLPLNIAQAPGSIVGHLNIFVSAISDQVLSNSDLRIALQFLIQKTCRETVDSFPFLKDGNDPQIYPPLWPGRLSDQEATDVFAIGEKYISELVAKTQLSPLKFYFNNESGFKLKDCLSSSGIVFSKDSGLIDNKKYINTAYGYESYDLLMAGTNVVGNDPDSIYHLLGQNGSLNSKPIYRPNTARLLEDGRKMRRTADLNNFYKKVSKAILLEIPIIHLGFLRAQIYINTDKSNYSKSINNSDRFSFNNFQEKL